MKNYFKKYGWLALTIVLFTLVSGVLIECKAQTAIYTLKKDSITAEKARAVARGASYQEYELNLVKTNLQKIIVAVNSGTVSTDSIRANTQAIENYIKNTNIKLDTSLARELSSKNYTKVLAILDRYTNGKLDSITVKSYQTVTQLMGSGVGDFRTVVDDIDTTNVRLLSNKNYLKKIALQNDTVNAIGTVYVSQFVMMWNAIVVYTGTSTNQVYMLGTKTARSQFSIAIPGGSGQEYELMSMESMADFNATFRVYFFDSLPTTASYAFVDNTQFDLGAAYTTASNDWQKYCGSAVTSNATNRVGFSTIMYDWVISQEGTTTPKKIVVKPEQSAIYFTPTANGNWTSGNPRYYMFRFTWKRVH